ncbi:hypothetical protein A3K82_03420 [Candidatus Pacearchaeota archaeon RBG_19FT_COMBO_34_9]|nr:MAG: hypothetical protein A3K82_03420 [Candidatus Pacearchaeota archaeon RBG_19FT_COMBO_34_9]OGJ16186.1 MAG: hypothetical protein A3K74_03095 [Candidatus Pacearchaeota archaeon RBG_13_33_26]
MEITPKEFLAIIAMKMIWKCIDQCRALEKISKEYGINCKEFDRAHKIYRITRDRMEQRSMNVERYDAYIDGLISKDYYTRIHKLIPKEKGEDYN